MHRKGILLSDEAASEYYKLVWRLATEGYSLMYTLQPFCIWIDTVCGCKNMSIILNELKQIYSIIGIELIKESMNSSIYLVESRYGKTILKLYYNTVRYHREITSLKVLQSKDEYIPRLFAYGLMEKFQCGYIIEEYIEGDILKTVYKNLPEKSKKDVLYQAGAILGEINAVTDERLLCEEFNDCGAAANDWLMEQADKLKEWSIKCQYLNEFLETPLKEHIGRLNRRLFRFKNKMKPTLIHGDYGFRNILVRDKHIKGIIDFEYGMIADIQYDLSKLIFNDIDFEKDAELRNIFLRAWEKNANEKVDWEKLWIFLAIQGLGAVQWVDRQKGKNYKENLDYKIKGIQIFKKAMERV